ncbi:MAG: hypothetical protein PVI92_11360 [Chromatiales bacterium]|jgi:hypothetical protein
MTQSDFPLQQKHIALAMDLYGLRARLMNSEMTSRRAVIDLERRLSLHLGLLARMEVAGISPSGNDPERFLYFATALQSSDEQKVFESCYLAFEQLRDTSLAAQPIYDAFTLYPPPIDLLIKLYHDEAESRAPLFALWRLRPVELPIALVNQAELQSEDKRLQSEAMAYAANHPAFGLSHFQAYYRPLLKPAGAFPLQESLLEPVLWGGLVRGDPKASKALGQAVEQVESAQTKSRLLRLMALKADPAHLPALKAAWERSPHFDMRWWALTGLADCAPYLIERLGKPAQAACLRDHWYFLSGIVLPERLALSLVDKQGTQVEPNPNMASRLKQVPDNASAHAWWEHQRTAWADRRWVMGQPDDAAWLFQLCREHMGKTADDLMDLLALKLGRPLGVQGQWGWQYLGMEALNVLQKTLEAENRNAGRYESSRLGPA